jgi:nucleoside-diphosphate-sugar epimerase
MILVTGASGLLGSFICKKLVDEGYQVKAMVRTRSDQRLLNGIADQLQIVEADILDISSLEEIRDGVTTIIHSAAIISFHKRDFKHMMKTNVEGTANIVNMAIKTGIKDLIHISSVAALGRSKKSNILINEDQKWENSNLNTGYALTKYLSELEAWRGQEEGLNVAVVNPSIILGPGDWNKSSSRLFKYVWDENKFVTKGSFNYVDVRDVQDAILKIINTKCFGQRFILNGGCETYKKVFAMIGSAMGKKPPSIEAKPWMVNLYLFSQWVRFLFTGKRPLVSREVSKQSQFSFIYDNTKVKTLLGCTFRNLEDTLNWTCEGFLKELKGDRKKIYS